MTPEEFEACQKAKYEDSYEIMRSYIPTNISHYSMKSMVKDGIPSDLAARIWEKRILWLICMHPLDLPKIHHADLHAKYSFHSLDIVEMRAVWHCLPLWQGDNVKGQWRMQFRQKLDDLATREIKNTILPHERRHPTYDGCEQLVVYDFNSPLKTHSQLAEEMRNSSELSIGSNRVEARKEEPFMATQGNRDKVLLISFIFS